ncbi:transcriptional regulator [Natrialbaceae archaeon GCM10025810]|uniref:DUF7527 domain-containing protein n=1 Tax=Halovalidus salilacus TaxID=3075124 RepID=UPI003616269F
MDPRTQERVEQWDSRAFTGGHEELAELATNGFSGAVAADGSWLFMLNGRVVGVIDGDIEDLETAHGTVYAAPHPSLPLLSTMQERGGETRAKYYTNETPLSEVDETLSEGSFTGYVELSEQVLSGDYYLVYYGGRRMAVAFIGNAERLLTDDEAFERADDEVGIYEVVDVDIEVTDVPGTEAEDSASETAADRTPDPEPASVSDSTAVTEAEPATDAADLEGPDVAAGADGHLETGTAESPIVADPSPIEEAGAGGTDAGVVDESEPDPASDETSASDVPADDVTGGITTSSATERVDRSTRGITDAGADAETSADADGSAEAESALEAEGSTFVETDAEDSPSLSNLDPEEVEAAAAKLDAEEGIWTPSDGAEGADDADEELEREFQREERWRKTRRIPSIDPEKTSASAGGAAESSTGAGHAAARAQRSRPESDADSPTRSPSGQQQRSSRSSGGSARRADSRSGATAGGATPAGSQPSADRTEAELESDMLEREDKIDQLTQRAEALAEEKAELADRYGNLESQRDGLRAKNRELSSTVEQLRARIEELEAELEGARTVAGGTGGSPGAGGGTQLSPERALAETNLFVRYESKSRPTLVSAHDDNSDRSEVVSNLQLERHTGFDASDVVVAGQDYETFLTETMAYRFVEWLTGTLLFEIRDTGHADTMADLYDAIPRIDRAELHASISLEDDDTEDVPDRVTFDVVAYDKMGTPLVVATLNDSREPATREMLEEMEAAASAVGANYPDLGAAMVVTSSYFEPGALEVTEQATTGGFLSRGSKASYVNLSRKQGYHLCLVESRSGSFHVTVPEL